MTKLYNISCLSANAVFLSKTNFFPYVFIHTHSFTITSFIHKYTDFIHGYPHILHSLFNRLLLTFASHGKIIIVSLFHGVFLNNLRVQNIAGPSTDTKDTNI